MRLTLERIHLYLLDKGFIEPASLMSGDYMATQIQTRNIIFRITRRAAKSLFVKQLNSFDTSNTYVLQKDATCQWLIKNHPSFAEFAQYVPDYFGFDPENQVLVTEYLADSCNLEEYARRHQGAFPEPVRAELAQVLASYHFRLAPDVLHSRPVQFFSRQVPWVLNLTENNLSANPAVLSTTGAPNPMLNAVLSSPDFMNFLSAARHDWEGTSLIHGDLKWMNLLLHSDEGRERVKVIDWELADIGDPLWDAASVLHGFVTNVVFYDPVVAAETFSLVPGVGLAHLQQVWPLMDHFWRAYRAHTAPEAEPAAEAEALAKTLRYTAARLVQSAIEQNMTMTSIQPNPTKLLQASYLLLTNEQAILQHFSSAPVAVFA